MYVLDTNTFSELVKPLPNQQMVNSYHIHIGQIYLATTVWQELYYGYQIMPAGKRKRDIYKFLTSQIIILPQLNYTKHCADIHASIRAAARQKGQSLSFVDSQIASIAMANDMILVTRNTKDFAPITDLHMENWFGEQTS